jgi:hypothetical protein
LRWFQSTKGLPTCSQSSRTWLLASERSYTLFRRIPWPCLSPKQDHSLSPISSSLSLVECSRSQSPARHLALAPMLQLWLTQYRQVRSTTGSSRRWCSAERCPATTMLVMDSCNRANRWITLIQNTKVSRKGEVNDEDYLLALGGDSAPRGSGIRRS